MTPRKAGPRRAGRVLPPYRPAPATMEAEPLFDDAQALAEAWRCLQCHQAPCTEACPAHIVIPRFIRMIRTGNLAGAAEVVRASNPLAASCGQACPDEQLCAAHCLRAAIDRPIEIRRLHRYATRQGETRRARPPRRSGSLAGRVAVVGAGPAGMACAHELWRRGLRVTLFEQRDRLGGVLARTIPLYRFPDDVVMRDAAWALGWTLRAPKRERASDGPRIDIRLERPVADLHRLARRFDAVFVGVGLVDAVPDLPGVDLRGVSAASAFLAHCRRRRYRVGVGREVVVIGGGNVAIDAALAVVRCGQIRAERDGPRRRPPRVHLIYRRTRREMPAWEREIQEAESFGVVLHPLQAPEALLGERGRLTGVRLHRLRTGEPDGSGRPRPVVVRGGAFEMPCDQAILATGLALEPGLPTALPWTPDGFLRAHPRTRRVTGTIYAGGDAVGLDQTIVTAVRDGRLAAAAIATMLQRRGAAEAGRRGGGR